LKAEDQILASRTEQKLAGTGVARLPAPPSGSPSVHLDALRGIAAVSVLLNHWRDAFFVDYPRLPHRNPLDAVFYFATSLGHQSVIVFFVLSGYLVGGSVLRSVDGDRWSWRGYLLARLTRLYIVLLPALLLGGALDWAGMHMPGTTAVYDGRSGMKALATDVHATLNLHTFVENGLFLQTIALPGMRGQTVPVFGSNGVLWSLSYEFWYYMAFPLLVLLLSRGRSWRLRASCVFGLVLWGWFVGSGIALLGISWLMGALIALLPTVGLSGTWARRLVILAALAVFGGALVLARMHDGSIAFDLLLGTAVTVLIWITLYFATGPLNSVYVRISQRAARSSYTLYLVHLPLVIFLKASLHLDRIVPGWHMLIICLGILLGVILYAQLVYEVFEKNTERIRNWIKPYVMCGRAAARPALEADS
jgi:peptidoglycan/LPS O-acetylase OafA/YrhL